MPLVVAILVAAAAGLVAAAAVHLGAHRGVAEEVEEAVGETGARTPGERAGVTLTAGVVTIAVAVAVVGVLTLVVRGQGRPAAIDRGAAEWAADHATGWSTDALEALTHLGAPVVAALVTTVVAIALTARNRDPWTLGFLLVAVGGTALLTRGLKDMVDRVRPALTDIPDSLGPAFPSGHSSYAAAAYAAMALVLAHGYGRRRQVLLAGLAAALAVAVAATRVMLTVHWLTDVIAGLALGWAWVAVTAIAFGGRLPTVSRRGTRRGSSRPVARGAAPSR
jgi:undecaprenyl-diphosphatase